MGNIPGDETVVCPACGLLCDDLQMVVDTRGNLAAHNIACAKSQAFFASSPIQSQSQIAGANTSLEAAIQQAARLLENSSRPLIAGLASGLQGMRAVMSLADKIGATLDHMNARALMRNVQVIQNSGWQTTTLTEVRNRADVILIVGTDIVSVLPRFFERVVWQQNNLLDSAPLVREIIYLGEQQDTQAGISPEGKLPTVIPCTQGQIPEVVSALRALLQGANLQADCAGGVPMTTLRQLADCLMQARYSVTVWSAAAFDFSHAELTIQQLAGMVKDLNRTTRASGLPLGGNDGDMTANMVCTWVSGYPMRTRFLRGYPEHDPQRFAMETLLAERQVDVLLWISTLNPKRMPPKTDIPVIVLGHPYMTWTDPPAVFIPVGVPGIDHADVAFRTDAVVSLPLSRLRTTALPDLGQVLAALQNLVSLRSHSC